VSAAVLSGTISQSTHQAMSIKALLFPSLNYPPKQDYFPEFKAGISVPRILHQTFHDRQLPDRLQENVTRLRELNPGWEYRFYDDNDIAVFIQENYPPQIWNFYQRIDPRYGAARADLFRYLLLYKVGGAYLDIKSTVTRPLDEGMLPDDQFILSKWHTPDGKYEHFGLVHDLRHLDGGEYQQWHIISAPGHPFLKAVLDQVLENIDTYDPYLHQTGKRGVLRVTGPVPYTLAIERIRSKHPHRVVDGRQALGLEYNIYGTSNAHVSIFKGHYSLQTASIVRLRPLKRQISRLYGIAQYVHDSIVRKPAHERSRVG
jgi:mannosyltransferase OCH1-like enzyme